LDCLRVGQQTCECSELLAGKLFLFKLKVPEVDLPHRIGFGETIRVDSQIKQGLIALDAPRHANDFEQRCSFGVGFRRGLSGRE
jgi:hypothetical protein